MELVAATEWQYPAAELVEIEGEALVLMVGDGLEVLPRGVRQHSNWDNQSTFLRQTLHEVTEDVLLTATLSEEAAASHLLQHVRTAFSPALCMHGLPMWHPDRPQKRGREGRSCVHASVPGHQGYALRVAHVVRMATTLLAVKDAVYFLRTQRRPLTKRIHSDLLEWPVLAARQRRVMEAQASERGMHNTGISRGLVRAVLEACVRQAPLRPEVAWQTPGRPQLVLSSESPIGLYAFDLLEHAELLSTEDRTYRCSACDRAFTPERPPRPGQGLYCPRVECQRERNRINQARRRAREGRRRDG